MIVNQSVIFKRPKNWLSDSCKSLAMPVSELKLILKPLLNHFSYEMLLETIYILVDNADMNIFATAQYTPAGTGLSDLVTKVAISENQEEYYLARKPGGFGRSFYFEGTHIPDLISVATECMGRLIISDIKKEYYKWSFIKILDIDIDSQSEIAKFLILILCREP